MLRCCRYGCRQKNREHSDSSTSEGSRYATREQPAPFETPQQAGVGSMRGERQQLQVAARRYVAPIANSC